MLLFVPLGRTIAIKPDVFPEILLLVLIELLVVLVLILLVNVIERVQLLLLRRNHLLHRGIRCFYNATFFLKQKRHLSDSRRDMIEQKLDDQVCLVLEEHLEVLDDYLSGGIAFDSNSENVFDDLRHRWLPYKLFIFRSEHFLALFL